MSSSESPASSPSREAEHEKPESIELSSGDSADKTKLESKSPGEDSKKVVANRTSLQFSPSSSRETKDAALGEESLPGASSKSSGKPPSPCVTPEKSKLEGNPKVNEPSLGSQGCRLKTRSPVTNPMENVRRLRSPRHVRDVGAGPSELNIGSSVGDPNYREVRHNPGAINENILHRGINPGDYKMNLNEMPDNLVVHIPRNNPKARPPKIPGRRKSSLDKILYSSSEENVSSTSTDTLSETDNDEKRKKPESDDAILSSASDVEDKKDDGNKLKFDEPEPMSTSSDE